MRHSRAGIAALLFIASAALADTTIEQETGPSPLQRFRIGFNVTHLSNDYGLGLNVSSPKFFNVVHVEFAGEYAWISGVPKGSSQVSWLPFGDLRLGFMVGSEMENAPIHIYGGGGLILTLPTAKVSLGSNHLGGFGLAGLEFRLRKPGFETFFVELGGMGTGARADQLTNNPLYCNGFLASWGFRYAI